MSDGGLDVESAIEGVSFDAWHKKSYANKKKSE